MKVRSFFGALPLVCAVVTLGAFAPTAAQADTVVVTPSTMGSWAFDNRDVNGTVITPTTGSMENGPATPPLGTGSANLVTPAGGGDGASELRSTGYNGVLVTSINALSYSTYNTQNNGSQFPYLGLMISWGGTAVDDILFFEPPYQTPSSGNPALPNQGATVQNQWQTWNALTGGWWADSLDNDAHKVTDGCAEGAYVCSLSTYLALHPDATIVNTADGLGGVRFDQGFARAGDNFNGNVDAFSIGVVDGPTTTYDFEAAGAATPLPAALPMFGSALGLAGGYFGWRRKRKVAAAA